jgi:hypothetical protein
LKKKPDKKTNMVSPDGSMTVLETGKQIPADPDRERYLHMASTLGMVTFALEAIRDGIGPSPQAIARQTLELIQRS